jgi:hypothetical protein
MELAAKVAITTLNSTPTSVEVARLVAFDTGTFVLYRRELDSRS